MGMSHVPGLAAVNTERTVRIAVALQRWGPCCLRRETMARLLERSGNATSLPYFFCHGNHEVRCKSPF